MNVHLSREPVAFGTTIEDVLNRTGTYAPPQTGPYRDVHTGRYASETINRIDLLARDTILGTLVLTLFLTYALTRSVVSTQSIGPAIKRGTDIFASAAGLVLLSPFLAIVAIAIKLDSQGPVFYSQRRVGRDRRRNRFKPHRNGTPDRRRDTSFGKQFLVYKFRSMRQDAEKKSGPVWASENDPRITRVGAFLRRTRIDELPQLLNVLKGEMSLVGPRPERPHFVVELTRQIPDYPERLTVRPGITGLAQVENGYDSSVDSVREKVQYDLTYIKKWSIMTDIRILLKTAMVVLTGFGAR